MPQRRHSCRGARVIIRREADRFATSPDIQRIPIRTPQNKDIGKMSDYYYGNAMP
jgi:hypothetical protein